MQPKQEKTHTIDGDLSSILQIGEIRGDPPLAEELRVNMRWQWDNNKDSCGNALSTYVIAQQKQNALLTLQYGQRHNAHVVQLYKTGFDTLANAFWILLVGSGSLQPDVGELVLNLRWQYDNNINSLAKAWQYLDAGDEVTGMYYLMDGQRHNPHVMNVYRTCYGADASSLKDAVKKLVVG